jgi:hypothetical protein
VEDKEEPLSALSMKKTGSQRSNQANQKAQNEEGKDGSEEDSQSEDQINTNSELVSKQDSLGKQIKESSDQSQDGEEENQLDSNLYEYKLVGVLVHMGSSEAGHYFSYINIERDKYDESDPRWIKTDKQTWLEFNDKLIQEFDFTTLEENTFGGGSDIHDIYGMGNNNHKSGIANN